MHDLHIRDSDIRAGYALRGVKRHRIIGVKWMCRAYEL
jgi:hypothetical protein